MGQPAWNGQALMRSSPCQWSLPSFQELLSAIGAELHPNPESLRPALVLNNFTKSANTIPRVECNASATAAVNHHEIPSYCKLRATKTSDAVPDVLARMDLPRSPQRCIKTEQISAPGPSLTPCSCESKVGRDANLLFTSDEQIALTKSGRQRKRLQKACDTCREKKVLVAGFYVLHDPDLILR